MGKKDLVRFSISVDWELLKDFDEAIEKEGYENRSFAIRSLLREFVLTMKSKKTENITGLFIVMAIFNKKLCRNYESSFSLTVPIKDNRNLCLCIVEGDKKMAGERFKEFNSNPDVEYCKLITVETDVR